MNDFNLHLNITQDIGHGVTLIFICAVAILLAVLIDLSTGVERAKKCKERIKSRILRRTISKVVDYYRLLFFGVIIDVLGLAFTWYNVPYCAVVVAVGVVLIEYKSVLENYKKMKSPASKVPDAMADAADAIASKDIKELIDNVTDKENEHAKRTEE